MYTCYVSLAEKHPTISSTTLMKLSFDEEHRNTMCTLGCIHALSDLITVSHPSFMFC